MANYRPGIVLIGMETSGQLRRRFQALGFETYSVDLLPSEDGGEEGAYSDDGIWLGRHIVGDLFRELDNMWANDLWPTALIAHPECTYLTGSAAWAFNDPDYMRYPGVGYHQRVKPDTLTGAARRQARDNSLNDVRKIIHQPINIKVIENPVGAIGSSIAKAHQIVQPWQFGDDASKATCLWFYDKEANPLDMRLMLDPAKRVNGRKVIQGDRFVERWANQTDKGQNKLTPDDDRWKDRSRTYPGIADALTATVAARL